MAQVLPSPPSDSPDGPDGATMAPVADLVRYMSHVDRAVFALGLRRVWTGHRRTFRTLYL